jgi:hypothetical protein
MGIYNHPNFQTHWNEQPPQTPTTCPGADRTTISSKQRRSKEKKREKIESTIQSPSAQETPQNSVQNLIDRLTAAEDARLAAYRGELEAARSFEDDEIFFRGSGQTTKHDMEEATLVQKAEAKKLAREVEKDMEKQRKSQQRSLNRSTYVSPFRVYQVSTVREDDQESGPGTSKSEDTPMRGNLKLRPHSANRSLYPTSEQAFAEFAGIALRRDVSDSSAASSDSSSCGVILDPEAKNFKPKID